jgi:hypothetical protein
MEILVLHGCGDMLVERFLLFDQRRYERVPGIRQVMFKRMRMAAWCAGS